MSDWPYSMAKLLLNKVISEMNSYGKYWFMETATVLSFTTGNYIYNMNTLGIDPKSITKIEAVTDNPTGSNVITVLPINYYDFTLRYPASVLQDEPPRFFSRYNTSIYFNHAPQSDYQITVYHLAEIPMATQENDTLMCPDKYEHVFQDGVYAYLLNRQSRSDANTAYALWQTKIKNMVANVEMDDAMATQLPAAF